MKISKKIIISLLLLMLKVTNADAHPFYVSIYQVDYNKENSSLEISVKIFTDDLLLALKNCSRTKLYLGEEQEDENADEYIMNYLQKHLKFVVNGKLSTYAFVGKEIEKDVVWTYLEIGKVKEFKQITVDCDVLTKEYATQNNIVQISKDGDTKSLLLNRNKIAETLDFNNQ